MTRDKGGNLYFGLLTADYSNPYRVKDGVARYDTNYIRGTIQKWSPKTKSLQTVATGIRVPYALAFNRAGDLFVTDQEGETWCPGGNPLDELNHIVLGMNYGFPPRHPQHLPNLVSEPPVVGFGPQHQSSCGFTFNEPSAHQKRFGPEWWEGDAFVAGQSRGKIWRVRLVKTPHGYIGKEFLIARLSMLTTDVAISPSGDLYASCHSGPPDWGTGPKGAGKIFKISYQNTKAPQPVYTWASEQMEVRVAFDRAIDSSVIRSLAGQDIEFGEYVSAGDRFAKLKPSYAVVNHQAATPRGKLKILSASLQNDNHTLVLKTGPHPLLAKYTFAIPGVKAHGSSNAGETIDVEYDLHGVQSFAVEEPPRKKLPKSVEAPARSCGLEAFNTARYRSTWLPHANPAIVTTLLGEFDGQARSTLGTGRKTAGTITQFKLTPPADAVRFRFAASHEFTVLSSLLLSKASSRTNGHFAIEITRDKLPVSDVISVITEGKSFPFTVTYFQENDTVERPLPLASLRPPWAPDNTPITYVPTEKVELREADYERGKNLFFGDKLKCASCHRIRGEGSTIGPDLSNLVHRDLSSILRDVRDPNAAINPDYTGFTAHLRDGESIDGFVRAQSADSLQIMRIDGSVTNIVRSKIAELRASSISLMPEGLLDQAKEKEVHDLLLFLTSQPPTRTQKQLDAIRKSTAPVTAQTNRVLKTVWVASKQDHGAGQHDYPAVQKLWLQLLNASTNVTATNAWQWPSDEQFATADLLVFYFWNKDWNELRLKQMDQFLARGGGIVALHSATISDKDPETLARYFGLAAQPSRTKYIHAPLNLKIDFTNTEITRNFPKNIRFLDEPYWPMIGDQAGVTAIATAELDGKSHPQAWTFEKGKGRVFATIVGHYTWTHEDPIYQLLVLRGMAWAAQADVNSLDSLPAIRSGIAHDTKR